MVAYVINDMEVTDPALLEEYKKLSPATVAQYGGRFLARGGAMEVHRGHLAAEAAGDTRVPEARAGEGVGELAGVRARAPHPAAGVALEHRGRRWRAAGVAAPSSASDRKQIASDVGRG